MATQVADLLVQVANETTVQLKDIWTKVGVEQECQTDKLKTLADAIEKLYTKEIQDETTIRDNLKQQIAETTQAVDELCKALEEYPEKEEEQDPSKEEQKEDSSSLRKQLEAIQVRQSKLTAFKKERVDKLSELVTSLHDLWEKLEEGDREDEKEDAGDDNDISATRVKHLSECIVWATAKTSERLQHVEETAVAICELIEEIALQGADLTDLDQRLIGNESSDSLGPGASMKKALERRHKELVGLRNKRAEEIKSLAFEITSLWHQLGVPDQSRQNFLAQHSGLGTATLLGCQQELEKLKQQKQESLAHLIHEARGNYAELADYCRIPAEERQHFFQSFGECPSPISDEVLEILVQECNQLNQQKAKLKPILDLIERRETLRAEHKEFQKTAQDPNRFKIAGQLLREEKARKKFTIVLPKVENKLRTVLAKWEVENGQALILDGESYLDTMDRQQNEKKRAAQEKKAAQRREKQAKREAAQRMNEASKVHGIGLTRFASRPPPSTPSRRQSSRSAATTGGNRQRTRSRIHSTNNENQYNSNKNNVMRSARKATATASKLFRKNAKNSNNNNQHTPRTAGSSASKIPRVNRAALSPVKLQM